MSLDLESLTFLESLWDHQVEALEVINSYVRKGDEDWEESCMIALPTGVGKTGIIATFAHFSEFENVLVLSPRTSITSQNFDNIKGGFFTKLGYDLDTLKETIDKFPLANELDNKIIVSTIQKVGDMFRRDEKGKEPPRNECRFRDIVSKIDLLIIDEGHWEPADTWKDFLRKFDCPKILFTATPIRNDYSHFNVKRDGYLFAKPVTFFQDECYLKNVEFKEIEKKDTIGELIVLIKRLIRESPQEVNNKMLVRCENSTEIRFLVKAFAEAFPRKKVIGVHVNFPNWSEEENKFLSNKTPTSDGDKDRFDIWIHQYKMVEGFDEPRFGYLLLFSPFSNVRQLVQQIGRILRNPDREEGEIGYVFSPKFGRQKELWENYLIYDDKDDDEKGEVLNTMDFDYTSKLFNDIELVYLDKIFRKKFDKENEPFDVDERFRLPLSCNIKRRLDEDSKFDFVYSQTLKDFLSVNVDVLFFEEYVDKSFIVYYLEVSNSPYLKFEQVVETKTNVLYFRELDDHFVFYSSSASFLQFFDNLNVSKNVTSSNIKKLIASNERSRVSNVYLKNSAVSSVQYSSKKLWANDISKVAPSFDDSFHTLSNLWGFSYGDRSTPKKEVLVPLVPQSNQEVSRRYLGQKSGRITQDGSVRYNIQEFNEWSDKVIDTLNGTEVGHDLFQRFAEETDPPDVIEPYLIAFDFDLLINYFSGKIVKINEDNELSENELFSISNHCFEVNNSGEFTVTNELLPNDFSLKIEWEGGKFIVSSVKDEDNSLDKYFIYDSENKKLRMLIELINNKQSFKVFLKGDEALLFVDKKFIKPNFRTSTSISDTNDPVMSALKTSTAFNNIIDEKGHSSPSASWGRVNNNWPTDCLFGFISRRATGHNEFRNIFDNVDTFICDDMGTECADFIVVTDKRVSLIHAKASLNTNQTGSSRKCGASNVNDVVAQAIKNLNIINLFDPKTPKNTERWGVEPWEGLGNGVGNSINRRILPATGRGRSIWTRNILPKVKDPNIDKVVVCMLSNGLNKNYFKNQINNSSGGMHTESVHTYFLILNLISVAQQLGVKVEIYCNP